MARPTDLEDALAKAIIRIFGQPPESDRQAALAQINKKLDKLMATAEESAKQLSDIKDELIKANDEIQKKIQALVDAANNAGNTDPAVQAGIDALVPAAKALDDIVPDEPAPVA